MSGRRIALIVLVLAPVVVAIAILADPLNRLVARLEVTQLVNPKWQEGFWTPIDLPKAATLSNLADRLGGADLYRVLETRKIWIWRGKTNTECVAALVETPYGRLICLFRYIPWTDSWQARMYSL